MGNRLSAIATRTGDAGTTGLGDGSRVSKSDLRVVAMGDVDELNSAVGMLIALGVPDVGLGMGRLLGDVQQDLLDLGGELSIPGYCRSSSDPEDRWPQPRRTCAEPCAGGRSAAWWNWPSARR